jgi:protein ImuB
LRAATESGESLAAHRNDGGHALALVAKIKGAFRLVALDAQAAALGLKPGTALADARAMYPGLALHDADPEADAATHDAIVDWCRLFTPLAAPDGADGAILDITGAAHLFGGERALMATIVARLARQGFAADVAIAGTPGAAWALNRYGGRHRLIEDGLEPARCARIVAPMPLAALRLDDAIIGKLGQAGLRRIEDLLLRPRAPIAARFGSGLHHRLDVLLGQARDPISPRFEAPAFVAERRFADGIARREDIEATILALAYDLCGLLGRHGEGARTLDVSLYRVDGVVKHIGAGTSRPLRDPIAMARLFRERIEAAGEEGLDTGYGFDVIRLAALSAERLDQTQKGWDETGADASDLADLVDRLGARFGLARVTRLRLADSHRPETAAVAVPAAAKPDRRRAGSLALALADDAEEEATLPERPIRLLEHPEPIETIAAVPDGPPLRFQWRRMTHHVAAIEGPERIGPDWWRQGQGAASRTRDYFRAEDTEGQRFWLYREGLYHEAPAPRWYLHGFFA